jgi:hypothetical protein
LAEFEFRRLLTVAGPFANLELLDVVSKKLDLTEPDGCSAIEVRSADSTRESVVISDIEMALKSGQFRPYPSKFGLWRIVTLFIFSFQSGGNRRKLSPY